MLIMMYIFLIVGMQRRPTTQTNTHLPTQPCRYGTKYALGPIPAEWTQIWEKASDPSQALAQEQGSEGPRYG